MISKGADQGAAISDVVDIASAHTSQVEVRHVVRIWGMKSVFFCPNKVNSKKPIIAVTAVFHLPHFRLRLRDFNVSCFAFQNLGLNPELTDEHVLAEMSFGVQF